MIILRSFFLYHLTPQRNLAAIQKAGLLPRIITKNRGFGDIGPEKVWLTDVPEFIAKTQMGQEWYVQNHVVCLTVDCRALTIEPAIFKCPMTGRQKPRLHEYTTDFVPPECIINAVF